MNLKDLLFGITDLEAVPATEIHSVTDNSAKADKNALFVCICGFRFDGHAYAMDAYQRGCRAFVAEKPLKLPKDALTVTVPNTRLALAALACRFYGNPSHQMRIIGITGTKGKTTTAQLIAHLLNSSGISCGYIGTNGISYGNQHLATKNTTPDALTLQKTFADMLRCGVKAAVVEISSQALAQYRADGTVFDTLLFTNLAHDHIGSGEHADFEDYLCCKKRLFTDFPAKNVILWEDDPYADKVVPMDLSSPRITCSQSQTDADYRIESVTPMQSESGFGISLALQNQANRYSASLPLLGKINAQNAALAVAVAVNSFDIPIKQALSSLATARVSGRSEQIRLPNGACVCIDYAHNAFSLQQLLTALREYSPSRLLVLFGSVGERTQLRRREMGEVAAAYSDYAILTSDNPGNEAPERIIADIAKGFDGSATPYVMIPDRKEAILYALKHLNPGEILVLAGKGHEEYQLIGNEKVPFCERTVVEESIASLEQSLDCAALFPLQ